MRSSQTGDGEDMATNGQPPPADETGTSAPDTRFETHVSGNGVAFVAGGDQYIRLEDGVHRPLSDRDDESQCPYPGLAPFGPELAKWYFGRDAMIATLCDRLDVRLQQGGGPVVVIGPSGSGKSSLLAAGLLPALADGRFPAEGSRSWPRLFLTPTSAPALALAAAAGIDHEGDRQGVMTRWSDTGLFAEEFGELVHEAAGGGGHASGAGRGLVVVVDQFEEVFTLCGDDAERRWFIEALDRLARPAKDRVLVVLGVRADFYAACVGYPELRAALRESSVLLDPMTETELKQAIRLPARISQLEIEDGLVELLLADIGSAGGAGDLAEESWAGKLPLLAHALRATWRQRHGRRLTTEGYQVTGRIQGAIAKSAEQLYKSLPPESRDVARLVFLRLVVVGRDADDTRRHVSHGDLLRELPDAGPADAVMATFTRDRLLTWDQDTVTITHEALIRAWPRLRAWIEHDRADNLVRQDLEEAAAAWARSDREPATLYRGNRLEAAETWASEHPRDVSIAVDAFLKAARRLDTRGRRIRNAVIAGICTLALLASGAAIFAFRQEARARAEATTAIDNEVSAEALQLAGTDPSRAAQLALTAYRLAPGPKVGSNLVNTENTPLVDRLTVSTMEITTTAYSPHGHILATSSGSTIQLWDVADPARPAPLGELRQTALVTGALAFSPDGRTLATGGDALRLWNVADPRHPALLAKASVGAGNGVGAMAFGPDGRVLAAVEAGLSVNAIGLWNVADLGHPFLFGPPSAVPDSINALAVSPNGNTIAAVCGETVCLWDVEDRVHPAVLSQSLRLAASAGDSPSEQVVFSPDGHTLTALDSNTIRLWDITDPSDPVLLGAPPTTASCSASVVSMAFDADGRVLATGLDDGSVCLWNMADPADPVLLGQPLPGSESPVSSVAFSPDGHTLAAGSWDGSLGLWHLPPTLLVNAGGKVSAVAVTADGRLLAVGGADGVVRLWDVVDPTDPTPLARPLVEAGTSVAALAFSPDGDTLAVGTAGQSVESDIRLWDVTDPGDPRSLGSPLTEPEGSLGQAESLAFSPDGRVLALGDRSEYVWLWDVADPHPSGRRLTGPTGQVESVAFSPHGHLLAAGVSAYAHGGSSVWLWDLTDAGHPRQISGPLTDPADIIGSVAFSPDGRTLAAGDSTGSVQLWTLADPAHPATAGRTPPAIAGSVLTLAFGSDGQTLAAGGQDKAVRLWDVADPARPTSLDAAMTGADGSVTSVAFSPVGPTLAVGSDDGTVRLWDLDVGYAIDRICADSADALARQQWTQYIPQLPYQPPCPASP